MFFFFGNGGLALPTHVPQTAAPDTPMLLVCGERAVCFSKGDMEVSAALTEGRGGEGLAEWSNKINWGLFDAKALCVSYQVDKTMAHGV